MGSYGLVHHCIMADANVFCRVCSGPIRPRQHFLQCDICGRKSHRTCDRAITSAAYLAARKAQRHIGYNCSGGCPQPAGDDPEVPGPPAPAALPVAPPDEELPDQPAAVLDLDQLRNLEYRPAEPPRAVHQPRAELRPRDPFDLPYPEEGLGAGRPAQPHEIPPVPESPDDSDSDSELPSHHHAAIPAGDRYTILQGAGRAPKHGNSRKDHLMDLLHGYKYSKVSHPMGHHIQ